MRPSADGLYHKSKPTAVRARIVRKGDLQAWPVASESRLPDRTLFRFHPDLRDSGVVEGPSEGPETDSRACVHRAGRRHRARRSRERAGAAGRPGSVAGSPIDSYSGPLWERREPGRQGRRASGRPGPARDLEAAAGRAPVPPQVSDAIHRAANTTIQASMTRPISGADERSGPPALSPFRRPSGAASRSRCGDAKPAKEHGADFLMGLRHLWVRSSQHHAVLRVRSELEQAIADFLYEREFVRIDATILTGSSVEGTPTFWPLRA